MKHKKEIRMEDIARELNISIVSVSNALKNKKGVGEELRQTVKEKAAEMGYRLPESASEKEAETYYIGVMTAERFIREIPSFYMNLYGRIAQLLSCEDSLTLLEIVRTEAKPPKPFGGYFSGMELDGLIFLGELDAEFIREIQKRIKAPAVGIGFYHPGEPMDHIVPDSYHGVQAVTQQLIDQGHRSIGFAGDPAASDGGMDGYMGYCKAMLAKGLMEYAGPLNLKETDQSTDLPENQPTAWIIQGNEYAEGFLRTLRGAETEIPENPAADVCKDKKLGPALPDRLIVCGGDMEQTAKTAAECILYRRDHPDAGYVTRYAECGIRVKQNMHIPIAESSFYGLAVCTPGSTGN